MNILVPYLQIFFLALIPMITGRIRLEDHISKEDLEVFRKAEKKIVMSVVEQSDTLNQSINLRKGIISDYTCMGSSVVQSVVPWLFGEPTTLIVTFYLHSRKRDHPSRVSAGYKRVRFNSKINFDPQLNTTLVVHGFMSYAHASWVQNMASALLKWDNVNVILVDWSSGGNTWKYWEAVKYTRDVGADISWFLKWLSGGYQQRLKNIHCIGHSLGAHVCGHASSKYNEKFLRITGLDPALPCFETQLGARRLMKTDSTYLDVIHTNAPRSRRLNFGLPESIGHADFYPNGGDVQPGCGSTDSESNWIGDFKGEWLRSAICNHGRSYEYFINSVIYSKSTDCHFSGFKWDTTKPIPTVRPGDCDGGKCPEMGILAIGGAEHPRAKGTYYVMTQEKAPYCLKRSNIDGLGKQSSCTSIKVNKNVVFLVLSVIILKTFK